MSKYFSFLKLVCIFKLISDPLPEPYQGGYAEPAFKVVNTCPSCSGEFDSAQKLRIVGAFTTFFGVLGE